MWKSLFLSLSSVILVVGSLAAPTYAELKAPAIGTRMVWDCDGPYSRRYDLTVARIDKGVVRYEGLMDRESYFSEKHAGLTGTSLWHKLFGERMQWFDMEDFEGFRQLVAGSRFKGAVSAVEGDDKWVWRYEVSVGQSQTVNHGVLGRVRLVPVSEKRTVYHGTYWSNMTTYLLPDEGVSVSWVYEDPKGVEHCDLVTLER